MINENKLGRSVVMNYTLMHKNIKVADLSLDEETGSIVEIGEIYNFAHLPISTTKDDLSADRALLNKWWTDRSIPASRSGVRDALEILRVSTPKLLLAKCYGLSLSDQYWVKPINSDLEWEVVNFFDNDFSEDVGDILFGKAKDSENISLNSPDNTSDGCLKKRWKIINQKRCLLKAGSLPYEQQPFNEAIASLIMDKLNIDHVSYSVMVDDEKPYSVCVTYHISQIYESGELQREATCRKIQQVQLEGERDVERAPLFYNLDVIIAVGYRVNSYQATQFRIWATSVLKEFIIKGYVLDDERLKQGKHFGKDYFDDLLERIREIRTSERRYYQKITDIYAECSADYDAKAESTKLFYKMVQNMMHLAVTNHTAAEIVYERADAEMPHMGLTTQKKAPDGRVQKSDTIVAKNYLSDEELSQLNAITTSFLDLAESRARRHIVTTMEDWKNRLKLLLETMDYDAKSSAGKVSQEEAREKAYSEYEKYKVIQDRSYISDFDRFNSGNDDDTPLLPFDIDPKEQG